MIARNRKRICLTAGALGVFGLLSLAFVISAGSIPAVTGGGTSLSPRFTLTGYIAECDTTSLRAGRYQLQGGITFDTTKELEDLSPVENWTEF